MQKKSYPSIMTILKIVGVYSFALVTAVACGKFELQQTNSKVTDTVPNGNATVVIDDTSAPVISADLSNVFIGEVKLLDASDSWNPRKQWINTVMVTHGTRQISFVTYPTFNPIIASSAEAEVDTMSYTLSMMCVNAHCGRYVLLIDVMDSSNGSSYQKTELWDTELNKSLAQRVLTNTTFTSMADAYEHIANRF
jgi:hypothetical protein